MTDWTEQRRNENERSAVLSSHMGSGDVMSKLPREVIDRRLQIALLNVCLASVAGKKDDLRLAKQLLLDQIERMVREAEGA